jgi:pseudouridine-5'-phosphate glycosidase
VEHRVESPAEIAQIIKARKSVGTLTKALVVANPVKKEMNKALHDEILESGLAKAEKQGITGKLVTPFLLEHFHTTSKGESLAINTEIIKANCLLAAQIAVAL